MGCDLYTFHVLSKQGCVARIRVAYPKEVADDDKGNRCRELDNNIATWVVGLLDHPQAFAEFGVVPSCALAKHPQWTQGLLPVVVVRGGWLRPHANRRERLRQVLDDYHQPDSEFYGTVTGCQLTRDEATLYFHNETIATRFCQVWHGVTVDDEGQTTLSVIQRS